MIEYVERDTAHPRPHPVASVYVHPIDFERIVSVTFDQTRQYVCADRDVALHAMTLLAEIGVRTTREEHRETLRRRMDELRAACVAVLTAEVGGDDVAQRYAEAIQLLDNPDVCERRRDSAGWFGGSG